MHIGPYTTNVQFSPDGSRLAVVGGLGGEVKIFGTTTGEEVFRISDTRAPNASVSSLLFSPDGRWLATCARLGEQPPRSVKLWDAATGRAGPEFKGHTRPITNIAFRTWGESLLTVEGSGLMKSWPVVALAPTSRSSTIFQAFGENIARVAMDGLDSSIRAVRGLSGASGGRGWPGGAPSSILTVQARSADGRWIAGRSLSEVAVEDTTSQIEPQRLPISGHEFLVLSAEGSRLVSATVDRRADLAQAAELKVWDVAAGKVQFSVTLPVVEHYATASKSSQRTFPVAADDVAFSADGRRLGVCWSVTQSNVSRRIIRVWDVNEKREVCSTEAQAPGGGQSLRFSPQGDSLLVGATESLNAFPQTSTSNTGRTNFNTPLSGIQIWDAASGDLRWQEAGAVSLARFSRDGTKVIAVLQTGLQFQTAGAGPPAIVVWDQHTGDELLKIPLDRGRVYSKLAISYDGKRFALVGGATASSSGEVIVYDAAKGEALVRLQGHDGAIGGIAFSADGTRIATSAGLPRRSFAFAASRVAPSQTGETKIWDVATGQELLALSGGSEALLFSADALSGDPAAPLGIAPPPTWNAAPLAAQVEAEELIEHLLAAGDQRGLLPRGVVVQQIETDPSISEEVRAVALQLIRSARRDANALNSEAWSIVKQPGLPDGDYERALDYAREACECKPDSATYLNTFGIAHYRARQFGEALTVLGRSSELRAQSRQSNAPEDLLFLAMTHHRLEHPEQSRDYFRQADRAMQSNLGGRDSQTLLAEAEALLGLRAAAPLFVSGNAWRDNRDYDKALQDYDEALRLDAKSAWVYANRGFIWREKRDYVRALVELDEAIRLDPALHWAYAVRGRVWRDQGQNDRAIRDFDQAIRLNANAAWYHNERGTLHQTAGRYGDATKDFDELIRLEPTVAKHYIDRGVVHRLAGRLDEAIADSNEAIRLDPKSSLAFNSRGYARERKGAFDSALQDYDEAIRLDPKNATAYHNRGNVWRQKTDYDKAILDYGETLRLDPKRVETYNNRGNTWLSKNELDKALQDYDEAIRLNPKNVAALVNRSRANQRKGDYDKVILDCDVCLQIDPSNSTAYNLRGIAHKDKQEFDLALKDYDRALELNPTSAVFHANRAATWRMKGDYDKALKDYSEALRLAPKNAGYFNNRGNVRERMGEYEKALGDFNESIRLDAKSPALNSRAWLLATCPDENLRNAKQAVEDATKACELSSWNDGIRLETLAAAYAACSRFDEAVRWQEQALSLAPEAQKAERKERLQLYRDNKPYHQPSQAKPVAVAPPSRD